VAIQPQDVTRELEYRFGYDGLGRRVSESGNDSLRSLTWCGEEICQFRSSGGNATYPDPQGEWRAGRRLYQERDHLGSVRALRDLSSGAVVARFDYGPYGTEQQRSGSLLPERGYAGMYRHATTGLYLTHYRAYSPEYGRWLSRDPIREAGGINLYGYVGGNPVSYTDPLGLWRNPYDISDDAQSDAKSKFPKKDLWNGPGDAYRHCLASCMMTRENTRVMSALSGWANEKKGDWTHNQNPKERAMDDWSNSCGNKSGESASSDQDCKDDCMNKLKNGELFYYSPGGRLPGNGYLY